ncbi:MAG: ATP-binding protein [Victivallales bacterium]
MLTSICPLPYVDLDVISLPKDGIFLELSNFCKKRYETDPQCKGHYLKLANRNIEEVIQCPCGLCSAIVFTKRHRLAITGFIPYPRIAGALEEKERKLAKAEKNHKISIVAIGDISKLLKKYDELIEKNEKEALMNYSNALHEIKKLNRTVKQEAERMTNESESFLKIFKASEMMSRQFEIVEILAGEENLTTLPMSSHPIDVYKLFDKCARIYDSQNIVLSHPNVHGEYHPKIYMCEKTFPIIATALITNAQKYSKKGTEIRIVFEKQGNNCVVRINNTCTGSLHLPAGIYLKGKRIATDKDGSGYGLYIAQKVAEQHSTRIEHTASFNKDKNETHVTFTILLKTVP